MNAVSVLIDVEIDFFLGFLYIWSEKMPYCAVPECTNGTSGRNKSRMGIKHHCFPKEREEAANWWQAIRRDEKLCNVKDPRVCSDHFEDSAYLPAGLTSKFSSLKTLRRGAIPSLNIPASHPQRYVV